MNPVSFLVFLERMYTGGFEIILSRSHRRLDRSRRRLDRSHRRLGSLCWVFSIACGRYHIWGDDFFEEIPPNTASERKASLWRHRTSASRRWWFFVCQLSCVPLQINYAVGDHGLTEDQKQANGEHSSRPCVSVPNKILSYTRLEQCWCEAYVDQFDMIHSQAQVFIG